ncbi:MAG: hypothetical protein JWN71_4139 [Xanthobacteraceae bacterium]|nr:hypothetical protein [Xanthobacteraceae bacterium]
MLQLLATLCILIGGIATGFAATREIKFIATTLNGKPIKGQIVQRRGNTPPEVVGMLDDTGSKQIADIQCITGLQFQIVVRETSLYIGSNEWKDCSYGELKFVFNEVVWSADYKVALEQLNTYIQSGTPEQQFDALVAAGAYAKGDYGTLALATGRLKIKMGGDNTMTKVFSVLEKDSLARALGVKNGIEVKPTGDVVFTKPTIEKFNQLKAAHNIPFMSIDDPLFKTFVAKEDLVNMKNTSFQYKLPPS